MTLAFQWSIFQLYVLRLLSPPFALLCKGTSKEEPLESERQAVTLFEFIVQSEYEEATAIAILEVALNEPTT